MKKYLVISVGLCVSLAYAEVATKKVDQITALGQNPDTLM